MRKETVLLSQKILKDIQTYFGLSELNALTFRSSLAFVLVVKLLKMFLSQFARSGFQGITLLRKTRHKK